MKEDKPRRINVTKAEKTQQTDHTTEVAKSITETEASERHKKTERLRLQRLGLVENSDEQPVR